jgi:hypothetical protein
MSEFKRINEVLNDIEISARIGWGSLDHYIATFDMSAASDAEIVAVLRGSFRFREHLPSWENTVMRGKQALIDLGRDPDRLLRGVLVS